MAKCFLCFFLIIIFSSCQVYKQDILFNIDDNARLNEAVYKTERNYVIQIDDLLSLDVFTNHGEIIIDPNGEIMSVLQRESGVTNQNFRNDRKYTYLVQRDSSMKVPGIGKVNIVGKTIDDAESQLEQHFDELYKDSFVKLSFENKRVVVLGSSGGQIVPLKNQNTSLIEILALAGGVQRYGQANNIRIIRGNLSNPEIYSIDLNTISGMKSSIVNVEPNDIIYIEPWRRSFYETLKDISPILVTSTSILNLILILSQ